MALRRVVAIRCGLYLISRRENQGRRGSANRDEDAAVFDLCGVRSSTRRSSKQSLYLLGIELSHKFYVNLIKF